MHNSYLPILLMLLCVAAVGCTYQEGTLGNQGPASAEASQLPPVTVVKNDAGESVVEFSVPGLHCKDCAGRCEMLLTEQPGVESVEIDMESKRAIAKVEEEAFEGQRTLLALREAFPKSQPAAAE